MRARRLKGRNRGRRVVHLADEVVEGRTPDLALEHAELCCDSPPDNHTDGYRTRPRHEAPLIELLSQIRGLSSLRHSGQISDTEYERRRTLLLGRI